MLFRLIKLLRRFGRCPPSRAVGSLRNRPAPLWQMCWTWAPLDHARDVALFSHPRKRLRFNRGVHRSGFIVEFGSPQNKC